MQTDTHHELALQIAESLHRRMMVLEAGLGRGCEKFPLGIGFDDVDHFLQDAENALDKIYNIERTIENYMYQMDRIMTMCRQPNPDWLAIFLAFLDLLEGEDRIKAKRDEQLIVAIKANLMTLETIKSLHGQELASHFIGNPFEVIDDVKHAVRSVIDFRNSLETVKAKFDKIRGMISGVKVWDVSVIIRLTIEIIEVIEQEDFLKMQRDKDLLQAIEDMTKTFEDVTIKIKDLHTSNPRPPHKHPLRRHKEIRGGAVDYWKPSDEDESATTYYWRPREHKNNSYWNTGIRPPITFTNNCFPSEQSTSVTLDSPFGQALAIIRQVMQVIEAVRDIEQTIDSMVNRYEAIKTQLLSFPTNPSEVIPYLINLIKTLRGEEKLKIDRDIKLADMMKQITGALHDAGYEIV